MFLLEMRLTFTQLIKLLLMYSQYYTPKSYQYDMRQQSSLVQNQYKIIIDKLSHQNQTLNKNVRELLWQNMALKKQMELSSGYNSYRYVSPEFAQKKIVRGEFRTNKRNNEESRRFSPQSKKIKDQESESYWKVESSQKKPTIIEELSESQFRRKTETPKRYSEIKNSVNVASHNSSKYNQSNEESVIKRSFTDKQSSQSNKKREEASQVQYRQMQASRTKRIQFDQQNQFVSDSPSNKDSQKEAEPAKKQNKSPAKNKIKSDQVKLQLQAKDESQTKKHRKNNNPYLIRANNQPIISPISNRKQVRTNHLYLTAPYKRISNPNSSIHIITTTH